MWTSILQTSLCIHKKQSARGSTILPLNPTANGCHPSATFLMGAWIVPLKTLQTDLWIAGRVLQYVQWSLFDELWLQMMPSWYSHTFKAKDGFFPKFQPSLLGDKGTGHNIVAVWQPCQWPSASTDIVGTLCWKYVYINNPIKGSLQKEAEEKPKPHQFVYTIQFFLENAHTSSLGVDHKTHPGEPQKGAL